MTKQDSKSTASEFSDDVVGRLTTLLTEVDDDSELSSDQFPIKEEKIEKIMQELYTEISCSSFTKVDSISPLSTFTSPLPSPSISSISSLPFDGKSDSCGASISVSGSTVMAGVEFGGGTTRNIGSLKVGLTENMLGRGSSGVGNHEKMEGCDGWEVGDEWLARVLGGGPPLDFEEWA
ncbi:hypothetical protein ACOSQ2_015844 [Xanthoceras sorbifolium]